MTTMTTATPNYTIKEATEQDVPEILAMIQELAAHTNNSAKVEASEDSLRATLRFADHNNNNSNSGASDPARFARTFLIFPIVPDSVSGGKILPSHRKGIPLPPAVPPRDARPVARPAGMALFFPNYSTWQARPGIYLEDLIVRAEHRGKGYGRALLSALARETARTGGKRLEWGVQRDNTGSIAFYESERVGAERQTEWSTYRVTGAALERLGRDGDK